MLALSQYLPYANSMVITDRDSYIEGLKANIRRSEANIAECEMALKSAKPNEADMLREMIALHKRFINVRQTILDDLKPLQPTAVAA